MGTVLSTSISDPIMETEPPSITTQNNTLSNETDAEVAVVPIAVGAGCAMLLIVGIIIAIVIVIIFRWRRPKHSFIVNEDGMMMNSMSLTGECILYVNIDKYITVSAFIEFYTCAGISK